MIQIIELVAIAAFAGSLLFGLHAAWSGFKTSIAAPFVQKQIAADQAKLDASEKRATDAERAMHDAIAANETLQADVGTIRQQGQKCTDEVREWKVLADRALTTASKNEATAKSALAQLNADRQKNLDRGHLPPSANASCQQILTAIDEDSADLARKRAMLFPPELAPTSERLKVGPAGAK